MGFTLYLNHALGRTVVGYRGGFAMKRSPL